MHNSLAEHYLENVALNFRKLKELAEGAARQVDDEEFFRVPGDESNSIAVVFKHVGGNLRSRWTDFLTSDGEKADRARDTEFIAEGESRAAILEKWEEGWARLFEAVGSLAPGDLLRSVKIRGESHTVVEAVNRQLTHYAYHVGQIVFLAKLYKSGEWKTLSVARGRSGAFNEEMRDKHEKA
ncbi:MAG TPA: DUF1572 family protein [Pyrinomonadaceae bacterium]|jgi:hypothetical protein|nr:DUF1572 family protein [Pyrinomonadaceae bacterium]